MTVTDIHEINTAKIYKYEPIHSSYNRTLEYSKLYNRFKREIETILIAKGLAKIHEITTKSQFDLLEKRYELECSKYVPYEEYRIKAIEIPNEENGYQGSIAEVNFGTKCLVKKAEISDNAFSVIFAFALHQEPLTSYDEFLKFHLENSYEGNNAAYSRFLTLVLREYTILFTVLQTQTVQEWIETATTPNLIHRDSTNTPEGIPEIYLPYINGILNENKSLKTEIEEIKGRPNYNSEYTTARQIHALRYMLTVLKGLDSDKTEQARFYAFIMDKSYHSIYERVKTPLLNDTPEKVKKDLAYVRDFFSKLGLEGIVSKINEEINKS